MPSAARKANYQPTAAPVHGAEDMNSLYCTVQNPCTCMSGLAAMLLPHSRHTQVGTSFCESAGI